MSTIPDSNRERIQALPLKVCDLIKMAVGDENRGTMAWKAREYAGRFIYLVMHKSPSDGLHITVVYLSFLCQPTSMEAMYCVLFQRLWGDVELKRCTG